MEGSGGRGGCRGWGEWGRSSMCERRREDMGNGKVKRRAFWWYRIGEWRRVKFKFGRKWRDKKDGAQVNNRTERIERKQKSGRRYIEMGKNAQLRKQRAKTAIHTTSTTTGESIHEHLKLLATIPITNPQIQTKLLDLVEQIPEHTKLAHALRKKQFRNAQNIISSNAGKITLGKLQRWIRECDDVKPVLAASDEQMGENEEMNAEEREDDEKWKTMEMIIRSANRNEKESTLTTKRTLIKQPPWVCPRTLRARQEMYKMVCERNICCKYLGIAS